ncbi:universal stress protein [Haloarcula sp. 1CSR25-25]|uniref:universal stress protein n=1 Tax=Haloarcula sp. 1CSR25-25 TaxID=2862545 RepID=UPI0028951A0D|nr:universal stress protein [Haloarcula sp. 1CSR25-25]MDT3435936.1 universal stress protein [Haloarcula sp. 1CSR25-25]
MTDRPSILVPIRVLEGESVPEGVPKLLAHAHVVLLGYHVIPEQTAPGQARMQFEDRAVERLDMYEEMFEAAGATVERRLVFTHNGQKTIDRMTVEHDCMAVLVPNATGTVENVLVPVRGAIGVDRLARVVARVFGNTDAAVTVYHVADEDATDEEVQTLLNGMVDRLAEFGMDPSRVETRIEHDQDPLDAIADVAESFDTVVMGETDPSLATFVFGMPADQVADRFLGPVFVVQREPAPGDEDE